MLKIFVPDTPAIAKYLQTCTGTKRIPQSKHLSYTLLKKFETLICVHLSYRKTRLTHWTTNLEHTNFSQGNFLYQRIVLGFHELLNRNDRSIFFISAFEHHAIRSFADFLKSFKLIHLQKKKNVRRLSLYQVLSISRCRSINRSADEVTDWDKKFTRRQQTFALEQNQKH